MDVQALRDHVSSVVAPEWGANVRRRRVELRLTQGQLVELIGGGVTVQTLSKTEKGQMIPRDYLRLALAIALALDVSELFPPPTRRALARFTSAA